MLKRKKKYERKQITVCSMPARKLVQTCRVVTSKTDVLVLWFEISTADIERNPFLDFLVGRKNEPKNMIGHNKQTYMGGSLLTKGE